MADTATKVMKTTKPKVAPAHPTYAVMVEAAVKALKERTGSSRQAILKYITANYKLGDDTKKVGVPLRLALKKGITAGTLKMAKETGKGAGCYKIGEKAKEEKKPKKPVAKKPVAKKPVAKKPKKDTVKKTAKKPVQKVKTPKKTNPKKAEKAKKVKTPKKTVKKPVAKKAPVKKATAKPKKK